MERSEDKAKKRDYHENHSVEEPHDQIDIWYQQSENRRVSVKRGSNCSRRTNFVGENELLEYGSKYSAAHSLLAEKESDASAYWFDVCNTECPRFFTSFEIHSILNTEDGWLERVPGKPEPIILASFLGHDATLSQLINEGVSVNSVDSLGRMALFWAASRGHQSAVEILLADCAVQLKGRTLNDTTGSGRN